MNDKQKLKNIMLDTDCRFIPGLGKVILLKLSDYNFLIKMTKKAIKTEQIKGE